METENLQVPVKSLYERLGGEKGLRKIASDVLDKNLNNSRIAHYFHHVDMDKLKQLVFEFFSMGLGGPHTYSGRDMVTAHKGLDISETDFEIANVDTVRALKENGIGEKEIEEVIAILNSMKQDVIKK